MRFCYHYIHAINQIFQCKKQLVTINEVPIIEIPLKTANIRNSFTGGQGLLFCSYKIKCNTKKCKCKQHNILCSSDIYSNKQKYIFILFL